MYNHQENRDENPKPGAVRPQKKGTKTNPANAAVQKFGAFITQNYGWEQTPLTLEYIQSMLDPYVKHGQDLQMMEACLTEINRMVGGFEMITTFFDLVDTSKPNKEMVMNVAIGEQRFSELPKGQQKLFYTMALMVARIKLENVKHKEQVAELAEYCLTLEDKIYDW